MKNFVKQIALGAMLVSGALVAVTAQAASWTVLDLGPANGNLRLNNAGQVVGSYNTGVQNSGNWTSFVTGPNGANRVNISPLDGSDVLAVDINDAGQFVAQSSASATTPQTGYPYATATYGSLLQALPATSYLYGAGAINQLGQVVGYNVATSSMFLTGPNGQGLTPLTVGNGNSSPRDLNSSGQVLYIDQAGGVFITGPNGQGSSRVTPSVPVDYMSGYALNDAGQVVGSLRRGGDNLPRAFVTGANGVGVVELGNLGAQYSEALGVNKLGQVVGMLDTPVSGGGSHAFITGPNGTGIRDLSLEVKLPVGYLTSAYAINDKGQVAAFDYYNDRAYLLTPVIACSAKYKVTSSSATKFSAQVTVANLTAASLTGWNVGWTYSAATKISNVSNASISINAAHVVSAGPFVFNKTIKANGSTVFTFTGTKGAQVPAASDFKAVLGGNVCSVTVQ